MKIAVAVTGASGSIYARQLLLKLAEKETKKQIKEASLVLSDNAKDVWKFELGKYDAEDLGIKTFSNSTYFAPMASGSAKYDALIICPCSMGTLARIAHGISDSLITRAADVMLKERKKLILVTREMPLNLIQIQNMAKITEAGGIVCPASPSFYHHPKTAEELADTVIDRVLDLVGINIKTKRWES